MKMKVISIMKHEVLVLTLIELSREVLVKERQQVPSTGNFFHTSKILHSKIARVK